MERDAYEEKRLVRQDLFVNLVGAVAFSVIGYTTLKTSKSSRFTDGLTIRPAESAEADAGKS